MSFSWEIKVKGFGPFTSQSSASIFRDQSKALAKVAIYSGNGQGKTCLSRLFRAAEIGAYGLTDSNITQGQNEGAFEFITRVSSNATASTASLRVSKNRGKAASITDDTNLLFHVFNSDYVKANLEAASYSPSGQIDGFIVGKENIDVFDKKTRLNEFSEEGESIKIDMQATINQAQVELIELGVNKSTNEFRAMTYGEICSLPLTNNAYDEKLAEYTALKDLPDDMAQLSLLHFKAPQIDYVSVRETITASYSRASFTDEFLTNVSSKIGFISEGMRLSDRNECPFCNQAYNDDARRLLHLYGEYLDGQEARIINGLRSTESQLDMLRVAYVQLVSSHTSLVREYDKRKAGFANFKETALADLPTIESLDKSIRQVKATINAKCQDVSKSLDDSSVETLAALLGSINQGIASINEAASSLNATAQRTKKLKTDLRKALCIEMSKKIRAEKDNAIRRRNEVAESYRTLKAEIQADEARSKRLKRDAVADMFETLMRRMFGEKYTFDKKRFCILFAESALYSEAEQILSDGEKSIVAFCHYIASTYELFTDEDDAQRLLFVIDDPISSLDYHYVYNVAQTIKNLGTLFKIEKKNQRFLVITHNSAFFNMLCRNKIVEASYVLHNGQYEQVKHNGITHYNEHLKDIDSVLKSGATTHTTGNSIRQVIEGIWHFDDPTIDNLSEYLNAPQCSDLLSCDCIYLLCNDLSHGSASTELDPPVDETGMKRACATVLRHINRRFPGQLKAAGIVLGDEENQTVAKTLP